jgi:hypothetical protein
MSVNQSSAIETVHRLLFRALLEIRSQGHDQKNTAVFHLADLFHAVVLEMENAAEGRCTYENVLKTLEERAKEKGLDQWLSQNVSDLGESSPN